MGLFDAIASIFSTRSANTVTIGEPVSIAIAKQVVSKLVLEQPLEQLRPTAEALQELESQAPAVITASMDHYCNGPRLVRFQNAGGKQLDVDTVSRIHAQPGVLQDEMRIQHLLGDVDDRRGRRSAGDIGHLDVTPLAKATAEALGSSSSADHAARRAWLFALADQLPDAIEATGGHIAELLDVVCEGCAVPRATLDADDAQAMRAVIVHSLGDDLTPAWRDAVLDPEATTTAYMTAIDIMRAHGLEIQSTVELV